MQKFLEELYRGNINPGERAFPDDPEYKSLHKKIIKLEELLLDDLSDEKKDIYDKLYLARAERDDIDDTRKFVEFFTLGARLMLEVMTGDDAP